MDKNYTEFIINTTTAPRGIPAIQFHGNVGGELHAPVEEIDRLAKPLTYIKACEACGIDPSTGMSKAGEYAYRNSVRTGEPVWTLGPTGFVPSNEGFIGADNSTAGRMVLNNYLGQPVASFPYPMTQKSFQAAISIVDKGNYFRFGGT